MLPARLPNLLVNGSSGIAVGIATNIPPHNLQEVVNGLCALIRNPAITVRQLMQHIPAPDFPTGSRMKEPRGKGGGVEVPSPDNLGEYLTFICSSAYERAKVSATLLFQCIFLSCLHAQAGLACALAAGGWFLTCHTWCVSLL